MAKRSQKKRAGCTAVSQLIKSKGTSIYFLVIVIVFMEHMVTFRKFRFYDIPKSLTNLITIYLFCFIDFLTVYLILDTNFNTISTMVLFKYCLGYPLFLFCDKKVPRVLFENYEIHPPTLWVLLGMCYINKKSTCTPTPPPPIALKDYYSFVFFFFAYILEKVCFCFDTCIQVDRSI